MTDQTESKNIKIDRKVWEKIVETLGLPSDATELDVLEAVILAKKVSGPDLKEMLRPLGPIGMSLWDRYSKI